MFRLAVATLAAIGFAVPAPADDVKNNPTGTWKYEVEFGGQKREQTIKLELKDGKLTGAQIGRDNMETKITDATFKDGEVAFTIVRERGDMKITTKYKGKIDGDTFKGTAETDRGGEVTKREFEAKREKK
jgi:hypothetical protein